MGRLDDLRSGNQADRQLARILDVAAEQHLVLPEELIFSDAPAPVPAQLRPGRRALIEYCESHPQPAARPGLLLITDYHRLGRFRDPRELWYLESRLHDAGWDMTPLDYPFCVGGIDILAGVNAGES